MSIPPAVYTIRVIRPVGYSQFEETLADGTWETVDGGYHTLVVGVHRVAPFSCSQFALPFHLKNIRSRAGL